MGRSSATSSSSSSSNIGETTNYQPPFFSYDYQYQYQYHQPQFIHTRDLSTDLKLGLSLSPSQTPRDDQSSEWPSTSINGHQQPALEAHPVMEEDEEEEEEEGSDEYCVNGNNNGNGSLYVKVYMEGHPIGRKLNVLAHHNYHDLITTLDHMFNTNILWGADVDHEENNYEDFHVLTYEDEEGDWLMVGDVPWEMFLTAVKRLKITRACPC